MAGVLTVSRHKGIRRDMSQHVVTKSRLMILHDGVTMFIVYCSSSSTSSFAVWRNSF